MSHFDKNAEDASQVRIEQKRKKCLVLDKELYRYQQFISEVLRRHPKNRHQVYVPYYNNFCSSSTFRYLPSL